MTLPKLIIFDCDGVLVDSEPPVTALMADYFTKHGLAIAPAEVHSLFTGGTLRGAGAEAMRRGATLPDNWFPEFTALMFDLLRQGVPTIPGVIDLIDACDAAGIATAIASNGAMEKMDITLAPSGLLTRFAGRTYSGHIHGTPKPAPDLIQLAMKNAGTTPDQTIMIDDSTAGCRAGIAAGVRTFGFATEGQDAALAAIGAEVVNTMSEIKTALWP